MAEPVRLGVTPLNAGDHVVVVGAGLAGWRFCEVVRQLGYDGDITLVGEEDRAPYDRPPLSKQILAGKWDLEKATLATSERLATSRVTLRLGSPATRLDVESTTVELPDGSRIAGSHVVIATGTRARALSYGAGGPLPTLRTARDVESLLARVGELAPASPVVVIGGGFVGAEVATSLHARGLRPIVLEAAQRPLLGVVGEQASSWLGALPTAFGVELHTQQRILDVVSVAQGYRVEIEGRSAIETPLVVAAVGSALDLDWLADSGLTLERGVQVDENLQAAPRVAALGDVANFIYRVGGEEERIRVEHWQVAADHAWHLAHYWMGEPVAAAVPYFWSDQYGKKIQMLGHPNPDDEITLVSGSPEEFKWLALYSRHSLVTGVLSLSNPRGLATSKVLLDQPTTIEDALNRAPWSA